MSDIDKWARNSMTFFIEDFDSPLTPEQRAELEARERERRKLWARVRRAKSFTRGRLRDTWGVLLHGLPDDQW